MRDARRRPLRSRASRSCPKRRRFCDCCLWRSRRWHVRAFGSASDDDITHPRSVRSGERRAGLAPWVFHVERSVLPSARLRDRRLSVFHVERWRSVGREGLQGVKGRGRSERLAVRAVLHVKPTTAG